MLRYLALALTLLVAVNPAIGVVCELDCDQPPSKPAPCHGAAVPDGATVRGATHACGHAHVAEPQALLTGATSRSQLVTSVEVLSCAVRVSPPIPETAIAVALHGPPGLNSRRSNALATVLRI